MENQRGKRHYEATLYFILACVAIAVFYVWVMRLADPAEQARVQYTLSNLRSAVQITELTAIAAGERERVARLDRSNPIELLNSTRARYAGEWPGIDNTRPGHWYFDPAGGELLYRVVDPERGGPVFRRFQLQYRAADIKGSGPGRLRLVERDRLPAP